MSCKAPKCSNCRLPSESSRGVADAQNDYLKCVTLATRFGGRARPGADSTFATESMIGPSSGGGGDFVSSHTQLAAAF